VKKLEGGGHSFTVFRKKMMKLDQSRRKEEDDAEMKLGFFGLGLACWTILILGFCLG
jgi:hypothetical protein